MKFVHITGFPRTGTTWVYETLHSAASTTGVREEQGIDRMIEIFQNLNDMHYEDATAGLWSMFPKDLTRHQAAAREVHWLGILLWKHWAARRWELFDDLCRGVIRACHSVFVHKTPSFVFRDTFPANLVKRSRLFDSHATIVCKRDARAAYESGRKLFRHWDGAVSWNRYQSDYNRFYAAADKAPATIIEHEDIIHQPHAVSKRLSKLIGDRCRPHEVRLNGVLQ